MFFPLLILTLFMLLLGAIFPAVYWFNVFVGIFVVVLGIKGNIDEKEAAKLRALEAEKSKKEARRLALEQEREYRLEEEELERADRLEVEEREEHRLECAKVIEADLTELSRNRKRLRIEGDYGMVEDEPWKRHVENYIKRKLPIFDQSDVPELVHYIERQLDGFEPSKQATKAEGLQNLSPTEFESACAEVLESEGWKTQLTKASGDQGVDIIASKPTKRVAIQCKRYAKTVGNKAVQEVVAGKAFIGADFACVVSNAPFTRSAKELASTASVLLLHFDELRKLDSLTDVSG